MTGLVYCLCLCAVLLNVFLFEQPEVLRKISDRCGGASGDDFFLGYYMRPEHCPSQTASQLTGFFAPGKLPDVYLSFNADPWPLMYYMLSRGFQAEFLFDGPRGRVAALKNGTLIIINRSESAEAVSERFGVRLKFLFENIEKSMQKPLDKSKRVCYNVKVDMREWRNWQTRTFEGRVVLPYGFNSRFPHQQKTHFCQPTKVRFLNIVCF